MRLRMLGSPLDLRCPVRYVCLVITAVTLLMLMRFGNQGTQKSARSHSVRQAHAHGSALRWKNAVIPRPQRHHKGPWQHPYVYENPSRQGAQGVPLYVPSGSLLHSLGIPGTRYVDLSRGVPMPVVLMAMSKGRFLPTMQTIASVQHHLPNLKIVIYDLGLTPKQRQKLGSICNVAVKKFLYSRYPKHVRFIYKFAWKAFVIQKALLEFGGVLWLEPSVRVTTTEENLKSAIQHVKSTGLLLFGGRSGYTTARVTHPQLYKFFGTDVKRQSATAQVYSAPLLMYNTKSVQENLMHWWVLCSLDVRCISPPGASKLACKRMSKKSPVASVRVRQKNGKVVRRKRRCHRFDQSVLNVLLKNLYNFDSSAFLSKARISTFSSQSVVKHHSIKQCKVSVKQLPKPGLPKKPKS